MKEGWEIKDLGDVCHFQNGFAFKSKTFKEYGEPVVRITNIQNDTIDSKGFVYIDRNDYNKDLSKYEVKKGDLLIAMSGATTGKIGIHHTEQVLLLNQRVGLFKPQETLNKQFLYYFLSTKVEESLSISAGAAQPNLSTEQIKSFKIPVPPLPEQQRIVSILDKAFAAIDKAKANAEKTKRTKISQRSNLIFRIIFIDLSKNDKSYENHFWRIHPTFTKRKRIDLNSTCRQIELRLCKLEQN